MNSRFCWLLVLASLVVLAMAIPATAARGEGGGEASYTGGQGIGASGSPVSGGQGDGGGEIFSAGHLSSGTGQGSEGRTSSPGTPDAGPGNQQSSGPVTPVLTGGGSGEPGEGRDTFPADPGQGYASAGGQGEGGDGGPLPVRGSGPAAQGSSQITAGPGDVYGSSLGSNGQGPGGAGRGAGSGPAGPATDVSPAVQNGGHGPVFLTAASLGGAGTAWTGSNQEGGSFPAGPGHAPLPQNRQQGPPPQQGRYPCGPAEKGDPFASSSPKEREEGGQPENRPRSRRGQPTGQGAETRVSVPPRETGTEGEGGDIARLPLSSAIFFLFGGYRRVSRKNVLDHNLRRTVYDVICRNPGIDSMTLATATGINENTLRYHLGRLLAAGKITRFSRPSVIRYFLNQGAFDPREQLLWHYLWSETPRQVLTLLYRTPGLSRQQLADAIGISGPSMTRQVKQLIDDTLVENRFPGRTNTYYLSEEAIAGLARAFSFTPPVSRETAPSPDILAAHQHGADTGAVLET